MKCARTEGKKDSSAALVREFTLLRSAVREISQRYSLRMESTILEAAQLLSKERHASRNIKNIPNNKKKALAKKMRSLNIKPRKGRAKDLVKIEKLLKFITNNLAHV